MAEQIDAWTAQIEGAVAEAAELHPDAPSVEAWQTAVEQLTTVVSASRAWTGR